MSLKSSRGRIVSNRVARKPSAKCIKQCIAILFLAMIGIHLWAVLRYVDKTKRGDVGSAAAPASGSAAAPKAPKDEYVMWSKDEAYMRDCELHYKANATWGRLHAPYVDKIEAKAIVERMKVPSLKIIPTLAVLDKQNISKYSLEFMRSLKQPYIIKSSHLSGGVARVYDNIYHCFKFCFNETVLPLGTEAFELSLNQSVTDINYDYSRNGAELQYRYITPHIIFEEDIISGGKTNTDVTFWWLSNGHPVFVSQQCEQPRGMRQGFQMRRVFLAADCRRLPIVFNRGTCGRTPAKPKSWNKQMEVMERLGREFPHEVVRVDVYGGGDEVWFSEFTFTTAGCWKKFNPAVADGLLYALMKGRISPDVVTPEYVERTLTDESWVLISKSEEGAMPSTSYPSPVDLCLEFQEFGQQVKQVKEALFERCIGALRTVRKYPLRCITLGGNAFGVMAPVARSMSNVEACEGVFNLGRDSPT